MFFFSNSRHVLEYLPEFSLLSANKSNTETIANENFVGEIHIFSHVHSSHSQCCVRFFSPVLHMYVFCLVPRALIFRQENKSITKGKVYPCWLAFSLLLRHTNFVFLHTPAEYAGKYRRRKFSYSSSECWILIRMFTSSTVKSSFTRRSTQKA